MPFLLAFGLADLDAGRLSTVSRAGRYIRATYQMLLRKSVHGLKCVRVHTAPEDERINFGISLS